MTRKGSTDQARRSRLDRMKQRPTLITELAAYRDTLDQRAAWAAQCGDDADLAFWTGATAATGQIIDLIRKRQHAARSAA